MSEKLEDAISPEIDTNKSSKGAVVTDAMVEAALEEAERWHSFSDGPPSEGAMRAVLKAAMSVSKATK